MKTKGSIVSVNIAFITGYSSILLASIILTLFLMAMPVVRMLAESVMGNVLMWPILIITLIGLVMSLRMFSVTTKEGRIVGGMVSHLNEIDTEAGKLPISEKFSDSFFVKHFQKFATRSWPDNTKTSLEDYLEEMVFRGPRWAEHFHIILPYLGLLGTALGLYETFLAKATGEPMDMGFANAIGTTVFALYGKLIILSLNHAIITERRALLRTVLVILNMERNPAEKGGET